MQATTLHYTRLSRRLAILASGLLLRPHVVRAHDDGTWHAHRGPSGGSGGILGFAFLALRPSDTPDLTLDLRIAPDGSARVQGEIRIAGEAPRVLIAPPPGVAAMCDCTDANRNDLAGLVRMATVLQDTQSDESVPVVLATRPHQDIDVSGDYETTLQVGEERSTLSVRVELVRKRKRG